MKIPTLTRSMVFDLLRDYILICFGLFSYTIGLTLFMLPYHLTTGGLTGICTIIFYATGFPVQFSFFIINTLMLVLSAKLLGIKFCAHTIVATFILTAFIQVAQQIFYVDGVMPQLVGDQTFMACVVGAALEGIGLAIVFLRGGSTGGTDIIAAVVNKFKNISLGQVFLVLDAIIISSSYLVFQDWQIVVMGFCVLIISSYTIDYVMNSIRRSVQFLVFSSKPDEIAEVINHDIHRGVTILYGEGYYSKEQRRVLCILAKRRESVEIFRAIKRIDPNAFVSQSNVVGVYGEGFDMIKA